MEAFGLEAAGRGQPAQAGSASGRCCGCGRRCAGPRERGTVRRSHPAGRRKGDKQQPLVAVDGLFPVERAFLLQVAIAEAVPVGPGGQAGGKWPATLASVRLLQRAQGAGEQVRVRRRESACRKSSMGARRAAAFICAPRPRGAAITGPGRGGVGGGIGGAAVGNLRAGPAAGLVQGQSPWWRWSRCRCRRLWGLGHWAAWTVSCSSRARMCTARAP